MSARRENMIFGQFLPNKLVDKGVIQAFSSVDRCHFLPTHLQKIAYCDTPLLLETIGQSRYTLPTIALMRLLQAADIGRHSRVLLIGDPTGYTTTVLGYLVQQITSLEQNPLFFQELSRLLERRSLHNVTLYNGAYHKGVSAQAPFDCIIAEGILDQDLSLLLKQLKPEGRYLGFERLSSSMPDPRIKLQTARAFELMKIEKSITKKVLFEASAPVLGTEIMAIKPQEFTL